MNQPEQEIIIQTDGKPLYPRLNTNENNSLSTKVPPGYSVVMIPNNQTQFYAADQVSIEDTL